MGCFKDEGERKRKNKHKRQTNNRKKIKNNQNANRSKGNYIASIIHVVGMKTRGQEPQKSNTKIFTSVFVFAFVIEGLLPITQTTRTEQQEPFQKQKIEIGLTKAKNRFFTPKKKKKKKKKKKQFLSSSSIC